MSLDPSITIVVRKGATKAGQSYDWGVTIHQGKLFANFGPSITIMFDDPQEGMDLLDSFTNLVVNYDQPTTTMPRSTIDIDDEPTAAPASSTDEEPF